MSKVVAVSAVVAWCTWASTALAETDPAVALRRAKNAAEQALALSAPRFQGPDTPTAATAWSEAMHRWARQRVQLSRAATSWYLHALFEPHVLLSDPKVPRETHTVARAFAPTLPPDLLDAEPAYRFFTALLAAPRRVPAQLSVPRASVDADDYVASLAHVGQLWAGFADEWDEANEHQCQQSPTCLAQRLAMSRAERVWLSLDDPMEDTIRPLATVFFRVCAERFAALRVLPDVGWECEVYTAKRLPRQFVLLDELMPAVGAHRAPALCVRAARAAAAVSLLDEAREGDRK